MSNQPQSLQITQPSQSDIPHDIAAFGNYLRKQRMLRGITHQEVVHSTKLRLCYIEALEKSRFQDLPQKTFVVGFLKAISKSLGLDEEELVSRYLLALQAYEKDQLEYVSLHAEQERPVKKLISKKPVRVLVWTFGVLFAFFLITLPHFLQR